VDARLKEALVDLGLSILKGLKVLIVYIIPSVLAALLVSPEFREFLDQRPELVGIVPVINFAAVTLASFIKKALPEDSVVSKVL
jgi:hypothetical protein